MSMTDTLTGANTAPHIEPSSIICGTLVTRDLARTRRMCEGILGLECVQHEPGKFLAREPGHQPGGAHHGEAYWVLEVSEVDEIEVPQEMLNHWGANVDSQAAVDRAYEAIDAHKDEFELGRVQKPRFRNGSYAFYFVDADSNWWEIEYREPELVYTALRAKGDQA